MDSVGNKLYNLRSERKMTQSQLGRKVGVVRQTVSLWEADRIPIKPAKLKRVCEVLEVDIDYFAPSTEVIKQESQVEIVACATVETQIEEVKQESALHECDLVIEEEPIAKPKGLTLKIKNLIAALVICGIFAIAFLVVLILAVWEPTDDSIVIAFEVSTSMVNFSAENIAKILLGFVLVIAAIISVFLTIDVTDKRKNRDKLKNKK